MNKKIILSTISVVLLLTAITAMAHTEDDPFVTDLMAGQHIDAGDVLVWNDGDYLYVKYETSGGWCLTETHLHVAESEEEIPQTSKGNPIPGHFMENDEHDCVTEYTYEIDLEEKGFECDDSLYVAAHAVVEKGEQEETAWGQGTRFVERGNWGMYFTYTVQCPIRWPEEGTAYIGYEDRTGGDFDYNDFGMNMYVQETYVTNCLSEIELEFESLTRLAGDRHDIHILRTLSGDTDYDYTITRSTVAQGNEKPAGTYSGSGDFDIVLFDTNYFTVGDTVTVNIEITGGCEAYNPTLTPPRWDLDPIWAFYDPWMYDKTHGPNTWNIGDWQAAVSPLPTTGYDVPYILVVPYTDWPAPGEQVTITTPYEDFDDYYDTGSPEDWYMP